LYSPPLGVVAEACCLCQVHVRIRTGHEQPGQPPAPRGAVGPAGQSIVGPQGASGPKGDPCLSSDPACVGPRGQGWLTSQFNPGDNFPACNNLGGILLIPDPNTGQGSPHLCFGATGPKGDKGDTGLQGAPGPTGPTGATGPKGDKGDKGDTGDTGATGATGPAGPQGGQGVTGDPGSPGTDCAGLTPSSPPRTCPGETGPAGTSGVSAWALISAGGTVDRGQGVESASVSSTGTYVVHFTAPLNVSGCFLQATLSGTLPGTVNVEDFGSDSIHVFTRDGSWNAAGRAYFVAVFC
jgi:hypothetical protein